jgi:hypothetical protein
VPSEGTRIGGRGDPQEIWRGGLRSAMDRL